MTKVIDFSNMLEKIDGEMKKRRMIFNSNQGIKINQCHGYKEICPLSGLCKQSLGSVILFEEVCSTNKYRECMNYTKQN